MTVDETMQTRISGMTTDKEIIAQLYDALTDAAQHLDFCGYGDKYERECAHDAKLPEKINDALNEARRNSPAYVFRNQLRIMCSLDEVSTVLNKKRTAAFHSSPIPVALSLGDDVWDEVYALIEARSK